MKRRLALMVLLARAAVFWERLWPRLWPVLGVVGVFAAMALLDLFSPMPGWLHGFALAAFGGALAVALVAGGRGLRWVDRATARRRLERDSGLAHRPLGTLVDGIAAGTGDPRAEALWQAHRERLEALRAVVVLLVAIAAAAGHKDAGARFERALSPGSAATVEVSTEAWITPPDYTGKAPVHLKSGPGVSDRATVVPTGSVVLARVEGIDGRPELLVGDAPVPFEPLAEGKGRNTAFRAEAVIEDGTRIAVKNGLETLASWPIEVVPDVPPTVGFVEPPAPVGRNRLGLHVEARDDYAVKEVAALIRHPQGRPVPGGKEEVRLVLPLPNRQSHRRRSVHDLTAHPWAGLEVSLKLEARDALGQSAHSDPISVTLPERSFSHPVAREIIELRKRLVAVDPPPRGEVIVGLDAISERPGRFGEDTVVFLALRFARGRLKYDVRPEALGPVLDLLWSAALSLEDGRFSLAERSLRNARDRLLRALGEGASSKKLESMLDRLRNELGRYLSALARNLDQRGLALRSGVAANLFTELFQALEDAIRAGDADAARELLAELSRRMEGIAGALENPTLREDVARMRRMMDGLDALAEKQRELLDRTYRRLRDGSPGTAPDEAGMQEKLRRELGGMMLKMDALTGKIPKSAGQAERAMKAAREALRRGNLKGAVAAQGKALEHLRNTREGMGRALSRAMGAIPGRGRAMPGGRDPFGRENMGQSPEGPVKIPDADQRRRAREILDELRRRAGDRRRSREERDYIERLLRRF